MRTVFAPIQAPASARAPCAAPTTKPDRDISQREVTSLWGRDRAALRECEQKRGAAIRAIDAAQEQK